MAVSGGLDSNALAHALLEIAGEKDLKLSIGHVNHALRGSESEADQASVAELARQLGVPVFSRRAEPEQLRVERSSRERPTIQEAARTLRYRALREMAAEAGCSQIATAHNANDQAETVLLRLFRGSGPDGLGGIPERSADGVVVRPLLRVNRAQIAAYVAERGFEWREDRSNSSVAYARNRLRLHWLPGLAADFNDQLLMAVGNLAEAQRRDSEWIGQLVEREAALRFTAEGCWLRTRAEDWADLPEALARRLARWGLRRCGGERDATRVHLKRMLDFLRAAKSGTRIELPGGTRLERDREGFRLGPIESTEPSEPRGRGGCR
ncbi:MAG: tRNA lysidine(34) synthetase TilS [Deltaproteobacteria bacterium]|nr:tRNA lysidine(34) synthetase TilS [Deltaproteobacteria bacterium]